MPGVGAIVIVVVAHALPIFNVNEVVVLALRRISCLLSFGVNTQLLTINTLVSSFNYIQRYTSKFTWIKTDKNFWKMVNFKRV